MPRGFLMGDNASRDLAQLANIVGSWNTRLPQVYMFPAMSKITGAISNWILNFYLNIHFTFTIYLKEIYSGK